MEGIITQDQIYYIGVNDRNKHLFEGLWPLPLGVSYNSYLIIDQKVVLVDSVDQCYATEYFEQIERRLEGRPIDYLVINHMEPDHSSSIALLLKQYPSITILCSAKAKEMIQGFYHILPNIIEVKDNDKLNIGKSNLIFYMTPMIHWPETMMTYHQESKTLFSGDAFGCFGTLDGGVIDHEMDTEKYWNEMYRYYSNIVGKYGSPVQKALSKLSNIKIETICSTHGPIWREQQSKVISLYDKMSRYEAEEGIVIAYGSMYGNTEKLAEVIARKLALQGVKKIVMHNVSKVDPSYILQDIFKYNGLILGAPTYSNELFPPMQSLIEKIENRGVSNRVFASFGSYTWAGTAAKRLTEFGQKMKWETPSQTIEIKQSLTSHDREKCSLFAQNFAAALKTI